MTQSRNILILQNLRTFPNVTSDKVDLCNASISIVTHKYCTVPKMVRESLGMSILLIFKLIREIQVLEAFDRSNAKDNFRHTYFPWEDHLAKWRLELRFHLGTPRSR